jgi:mono/diheme cytochrome c family protein
MSHIPAMGDTMKNRGLLLAAIVLAVIGITGIVVVQVLAGSGAIVPGSVSVVPGGPPSATATSSAGAAGASSVGERIYLTGVGGSGSAIAYVAPALSQGALRRGGGGCASCHGVQGRGATVSMMMMGTITAPDIRYQSLISAGFTDARIREAITGGLDETGSPLDPAMPRWQMSDSDVTAVIAYLKTL